MAAKGKRVKARVVRFGAQDWTILRIPRSDVTTLPESDAGGLDTHNGVIVYREASPDMMQITILHELLHCALPDTSERVIVSAEQRLKESLEACGVDLSPLIEGG